VPSTTHMRIFDFTCAIYALCQIVRAPGMSLLLEIAFSTSESTCMSCRVQVREWTELHAQCEQRFSRVQENNKVARNTIRWYYTFVELRG
jgi:hypothetical protein